MSRRGAGIAEAIATQDETTQPIRAVGRRDFMAALFGLGAGALACGLQRCAEVPARSRALGDWVHACGPGFFSDLAALRRLGAIYLAAHPEERSTARLSQLLIGGDHDTIPSRLGSAVARDWASHDVVVVDGWLLARAEARLCAFLHLEQDARA